MQAGASPAWARARRRRVRSPGPTSSTARAPARTGSSTSSTATRKSSAPLFTRPPRRFPAKGSGRWATTGSSSTSGRSTTSRPPTVLRRQGTPFWDYLDAAGIPSTFYDLPSNYPASPSHYGHHRCICGMGTPDMLGTYGTYQYFAEDAPDEPLDEAGGKRSKLTFVDETARAHIVGPEDSLLKKPVPIKIELLGPPRPRRQRRGDRDPGPANSPEARPVEPLDQARLHTLGPLGSFPSQSASGICRFFLQEVAPTFRLYVTPINMDPAAPAQKISEPELVRSGTSPGGWARSTPRAFRKTTRRDPTASSPTTSSPGRLASSWKSGSLSSTTPSITTTTACLFFYFSSSDLQSHIFWWDSDDKHPIRSELEAKAQFGHVRRLYQKLDAVIGDLIDRYGEQGDDHRDERPRLRQLRQAVQPQFLAARPRLPRPSRVLVDHAATSTGRAPPPTDWESMDSI